MTGKPVFFLFLVQVRLGVGNDEEAGRGSFSPAKASEESESLVFVNRSYAAVRDASIMGWGEGELSSP